ncbi:MAG: hypothetical protein CEO19_395 [Parcubacteria group bacterium Gr01-1014_73]|nr:MAG: hypothetical protein CEO19_395 [Parcubacteria group bacterium Gr01-1014_73]
MNRTAMALTMLALTMSVQANQATNDTILVRRSDLPPGLVEKLEEQQSLALMAKRIEAYGKWVGVGKEVGTAVNDSLSAITTQADNFAKTGVGKFTLFLVAWKVLGKDFVGVIIGVPLLVVWTMLFTVFWRRLYCVRKVLERIDGKQKFYKVIEPQITGEDRELVTGFLFFGYLVAVVWTIAGLIV